MLHSGRNPISQEGKRTAMAKVKLHPLFAGLRGKLQGLVFRMSHNGQISLYVRPDMSHVKWSPAQIAQRERFAEASAYAKAAIADAEVRAVYERMSMEKKNNKRPYDMALSDYSKGNNLLGDAFHWNVDSWRAEQQYRKRKRRRR
jgi:hypothetical protein